MSNSKPDLSIIIVTYRSEHEISVLLDSLKKPSKKLSLEVIVLDNASPDRSYEVAKNHILKPIAIQNGENLGFSKAINLGIKKSQSDYVLLLNPDTQIKNDALEKLLDFARSQPNLGAVAPRLVSPDGKPQASVFHFPTIWNAIRKDFFGCSTCFGKYLPSNRLQIVDCAVMAALLIPKTALLKVGLLDERFFMYYEDIEFARRLKKAKLPLYYYPKAKVLHIHGASGGFVYHAKSPLLASATIYYGSYYSRLLNFTLWVGHKWQVILRRKRFRD